MSKHIIPFEYEGNEIRTIMDKEGNPWWIASEVCRVLGYKDTKKAAKQHCKRAKFVKGGVIPTLTSSPYGITIIPESDLYRLIMRSHLPTAEKFQDWVVEEVLPTIRKTGSFSVENVTKAQLAQMVIDSEREKEEMLPKVKAYETFLGGQDKINLSNALKSLGVGRDRGCKALRQGSVLYWDRRKQNLPYQGFVDAGYFSVDHVWISPWMTRPQTKVTQAGMDFLYRFFSEKGWIDEV